MGTDVAEVEKAQDCSCAVKVHGVMCTQLETLFKRILGIFPDIEAARPRCSSGIQALCQLRMAMEDAKLLLQYCGEASKFYLAITGDTILLRFKKARQQLEENLSKLQTMVPMILELEISQIVDDLRHVVFIMGSSEREAGKVLGALLQKDESILSSFLDSEIRALQFVASRIHLTSQKDLLIEKRAIQKMLARVRESEKSKGAVLRYLLSLLKTHDKQILEGQAYNASMEHDVSFFPVRSDKRSACVHSADVESRLPTHDEEGITFYPQIPAFGSLDISVTSVSSCGSLAGLNLQIDMSNVSLGSEDTNYHSDNFHSKYEDDLGSIRGHFGNPPPEFKFFSSKREIETILLSNVSQLPCESQFTAIEDVQNYLDYYNHAPVPMFSKNFVEPLVGFLKAAVDRQDVSAQIAATRLLSTGVNASRSAIQSINEDVYLLLASFLGTAMTKDVLAIFQSSVQISCGMKLAQSGALTSILKILDTEYKEFHEMAIKLLFNWSLSTEDDSSLLSFLPLVCIPKLVPFIRDPSTSGPCIQIMEKLFHTQEARLLAVETEGCIAAIVELLETGNCEEQEHGVSILLTLCSQVSNCSRLVMEEGIIPALVCMQVNGNERGKVGAYELLRLLRDLTEEDDKKKSSYGSSMPETPCRDSDEKMTSKPRGRFSKFSAKLKRRWCAKNV